MIGMILVPSGSELSRAPADSFAVIEAAAALARDIERFHKAAYAAEGGFVFPVDLREDTAGHGRSRFLQS